jgi:hypothetical protein
MDLREKINLLDKELRELAFEIIEDLDLSQELEDKYVVFINKELYDEYRQVLNKKSVLYNDLHKIT